MPPLGSPALEEGPPSYWRATCEIDCPGRPLDGDISVDVAIVGGGYTGLAAAHYLADRGVSCAVLEANAIGWGASGRSAGFAVLRYKRGFAALAAQYGRERARRLHALLAEARTLLDEIAERYGLGRYVAPCGHLTAAHSATAAAALEAEKQWLARELGDDVPQVLGRREMREATGTDDYVGGYLDPRGGAIHPLNFVRGFAQGVADRGVPIHTGAAVSSVREFGDGVHLETPHGTVLAKRAIYATNAYTDLIASPGDLARRIVPVSSSLLVTEVIPETIRDTIMRCGAPLTDTKRLLNGYRLLPDGRLMVAGRADLTGRNESEATYAPLQRAFARAFPAIADISVSYRWSGMVALPRDHIPHVGMLSSRVAFALGCGGRGVLLSNLLGRFAARLVLAEPVDAGPMSTEALQPFPFHRLRNLGMRVFAGYYGLRDRMDRRSA